MCFDVIYVADHGGDGGGGPEVAAEGCYVLSSGGVDVRCAFEGYMELMGVVEGGMEAFGPGVRGTKSRGGRLGRARSGGAGSWGRHVLAGFGCVVGDIVDEGSGGINGCWR